MQEFFKDEFSHICSLEVPLHVFDKYDVMRPVNFTASLENQSHRSGAN